MWGLEEALRWLLLYEHPKAGFEVFDGERRLF
jgi:hypothetical protein